MDVDTLNSLFFFEFEPLSHIPFPADLLDAMRINPVRSPMDQLWTQQIKAVLWITEMPL